MGKFRHLITRILDTMNRRKRVMLALSCFVVFVTTYLLILPAFTLEKDEAARQGGIDVPSVESISEKDIGDTDVPDTVADETDMSAADEDIENQGDEYSSDEALADEETDQTIEDEAISSDVEVTDVSSAETSDADEDADAEQAEETAAQTERLLVYEGDGYTVTVEDPYSALPADTELVAEEILEKPADGTRAEREAMEEAYRDYSEQAIIAINDESEDTDTKTISFARFYDIKFMSSGAEISPDQPVSVTITYDKDTSKDLRVAETDDVHIIHFAQDEKADEVTAELLDKEAVDVTLEKSEMTETTFEAENFSVYAVIYTVDFHYEVNGEKYEYSIPGGGFISFKELLEVLDIAGDADTGAFVTDVAGIEFSDLELLHVSKVEENTTVGAIREDLDLTCEYSAEMTEEQIAEIDAQIVEAGDWALISLKPFHTEEVLTVTMKNGDQFEIRVTDYSYDATQITSITDGTYALVNRANDNALMSAAHSTAGHLQAIDVAVRDDEIITADGSPLLTKWTFTRVQNQTDRYYIRSPEGFLNMGTNGNLFVSNNRQAFTIQTKANGTIRIKRTDNNYAVNNDNNQTANGYYGYQWGGNSNSGEWFTLYEIGDPEIPPPMGVTIHFTDRNGNEISGVTYSGTNPLVTDNGDGTFWIPYYWNGATGSVHLDTEFSKSGYTYANTHLAGERQDVTYEHDGFVIDAELRQKDNTLMMYTDCGREYGVTPGGNRKYGNLAEYDLNDSFLVPEEAIDVDTNVGTTTYVELLTDKDIYVVLDPEPPAGLSPTGSEAGDDFDLTDPVYEKKLVSNGDGTYTLSLSITGRGKNIAKKPKANVVFIVDTSSSMQSNTVPDTGNTRLEDTKTALKLFGNELLATNSIPGKDPDTIEVAMVSFDGGVVNELDWTTSYDALENKIDNLTVHTGTDWEDGLKEGYSVAAAKMAAESDETTYVVFFTDGEPSNYTNFNGQGGASGGNGYRYWYSYFLSREAAKDEIRTIVSSGLEMYGVFAYNDPASGYQPTGEKGAELLHNAIKYGFNTNAPLENSRFYKAENTSQLNAAFAKILNSILEYADIHDVKLNDNITELTSVGITSNNSGSDTNYTAFKYTRSGGQYGNEGQVWEEAPTAVYDSSGVHWDLSSVGVLENGVTYKVSFVVWPSQEAYDWVADLNNGIKTWADVGAAHLEDHFRRIPDDSRPSGYLYEVMTNPPSKDGTDTIINNKINYTKTHSSIVGSLPDGAEVGVPFTDPETNIVSTYTLNPDGTTYTKLTILEEERAFGPPDRNMDLSDTEFKLEKIWTVNRPEDLVAFLYNTSTGKPLPETSVINFDIYQSSAEHPDQESKYKTIPLGYDEATGTFDWYGETQVVHVGPRDYVVGTIWEEPLDIAYGLMLSPPRMADRGLDSSDEKYVPIYEREEDVGVNDPIYYVLERGHDYRIDEPALDYRFDFHSDVYHPMLVDSFPRDAKIEYIEQPGERTIGILKSISPEGERLDALTAENILRGQLTLKKHVLNADGDPDDSDYAHAKEFPLTVELYNEKAPFHNDPNDRSQENVPWYGIQINGTGNVLYFHTVEDGVIRYTDEHEACVDGDYIFGLKDGYSGNIMTESTDYKRATATINVSPRDVWFITNIPGGTEYTVTEGTLTNGYSFVQAEELTLVDDGTTVVHEVVTHVEDTQEITGEIHSNHTTEVEFTNRKLIVPLDIELIKIDENDLDDVDEAESMDDLATLTGAEFILWKYTDSTFRQLDTDWGTDGDGKITLSDGDEDGRFSVEELPEGFYRIDETELPAGYVKSESDPIFEVRRDTNGDLQLILLVDDPDKGIIAAENNDGTIVKIRNLSVIVGNKSGVELPHTGGIGTRIFYILGSMLLVGCGVILIARRRIRHELK